MAVSKVFISYRREDTAWAARAVCERLRQGLGEDVFIDIDGIPYGLEFAKVIDQHLDGCKVMLAMIGPRWEALLEERSSAGDDDLLRIEITRALARGIPLVPVLIDRKHAPKRQLLPPDLQALIGRNALALEHDTFGDRMPKLVEQVLGYVGGTTVPASLPPLPPPASTTGQPAPQEAKRLEPWMSDRGRDNYGEWAEFSIQGVVQRMRWIVPGEFWMGSAEAERKRFELTDRTNEAPRHRVRLTQGFWLADTACTQALWQTVTGENPSHFGGDLERPVEQVSWDDVTGRFLPALSRALHGCEPALPTEAQWEYACRTGSETAFAFGESVSPLQANFDGNYPCPEQSKGLYRDATVAVKALSPNAWGLHQMHGNVWEWCQDGLRTYADAAHDWPEIDPQGPAEQGSTAPRAVRGGSWYDFARRARSAFRHAYERGDRDLILGFRLALMSSSSSPAGSA